MRRRCPSSSASSALAEQSLQLLHPRGQHLNDVPERRVLLAQYADLFVRGGELRLQRSRTGDEVTDRRERIHDEGLVGRARGTVKLCPDADLLRRDARRRLATAGVRTAPSPSRRRETAVRLGEQVAL